MNAPSPSVVLPPGFDDLAPLVEPWALGTEQQRYAKRLATPLPELRSFYDVIYPRMDAVLQHLAAFPAGDMAALPHALNNLYLLALSYFEASHPIELHWKSQDLDVAFPSERIVYQAPSNVPN